MSSSSPGSASMSVTVSFLTIMDDLVSKKCTPCEGGTPPLAAREIQRFLPEVPGWEVIENKEIRRDFKFKDFTQAVEFVNRVALLAEAEGHHPDMLIYGWNKVRFTLTTHAIGGLSENDFIVAAKINALPTV